MFNFLQKSFQLIKLQDILRLTMAVNFFNWRNWSFNVLFRLTGFSDFTRFIITLWKFFSSGRSDPSDISVDCFWKFKLNFSCWSFNNAVVDESPEEEGADLFREVMASFDTSQSIFSSFSTLRLTLISFTIFWISVTGPWTVEGAWLRSLFNSEQYLAICPGFLQKSHSMSSAPKMIQYSTF